VEVFAQEDRSLDRLLSQLKRININESDLPYEDAHRSVHGPRVSVQYEHVHMEMRSCH
jgi:hypothetical protein